MRLEVPYVRITGCCHSESKNKERDQRNKQLKTKQKKQTHDSVVNTVFINPDIYINTYTEYVGRFALESAQQYWSFIEKESGLD